MDGVRTDYGLTPLKSGSCGCSVPLPFSSGRHTIVVGAYNAAGETSSNVFVVGPTANAGGPYSGQVGNPVIVTSGGSTDSTGAITSYIWRWGDGASDTSTTSTTASHIYTTAGAFTITLTASDGFPASSFATATVNVVAVASPPGAPTSPSPSNGAGGVAVDSALTWSAADAVSFDVFFGTTNPPPLVASRRTSSSYSPAGVANDATYYWRIVARNDAGTTEGPLWTFSTAASASSPVDIVVYATDIATSAMHGNWSTSNDSTSPGGVKLVTTEAGWSSLDAPIAGPAHFVDVSFYADAGSYALWLRLKALNNDKYNDSIWVQFSDAEANGSPVYPLDSTSGLLVNLATDKSASSLNGWGWQNGAYWLSQSTTVTFTTSGTHTLRIQAREDGVQLDQIVLSPGAYAAIPPGPPTGDTTIVPKGGEPGTPAAPSPANGFTDASTSTTIGWTAAGASSYDVRFGATNPPPLVATAQSSNSYTPSATLAASSTYYWQIVAHNENGTAVGPVWSFTTAPATVAADEVVIYATDISAANVHGSWSLAPDSTSPGGIKVTTTDMGWSALQAPAAVPANYVDVSFIAPANTPYTLWLRVKAIRDDKYNDSLWVQFSDAQVSGSARYEVNTSSGLLVNLASDTTANSNRGWGWVNGAYWLNQPATVTFAISGAQTLRLQVREDGVEVDQIVLSPSRYLDASSSCPTSCNGSPGVITNDSTISQKP